MIVSRENTGLESQTCDSIDVKHPETNFCFAFPIRAGGREFLKTKLGVSFGTQLSSPIRMGLIFGLLLRCYPRVSCTNRGPQENSAQFHLEGVSMKIDSICYPNG